MAKKPFPILHDVSITDWAAKGKALARVDGMVVFVKGAAPGDVADLEVFRKKKNHAEARVHRLIKPSPERVLPFCPHFGVCGGCSWQHLDYAAQIAFKRREVMDDLLRIGGLELPEVPPTLGSPRQRGYRNKLEFTFTPQRWLTQEEIEAGTEVAERRGLGYHLPGHFDRILDIRDCGLQPEPSNGIRNFIKQYGVDHQLGFYHPRSHKGWLRTLTIRTTLDGQVMVLLAFATEDQAQREALMEALLQQFPEITSLVWCINPKKNDTIWDLDMHTFHGEGYVTEELQDEGYPPLKFRIGPKSFFQTNPQQAQVLYELVREYAELQGGERVYDLYCGAGSISLFLARHCSRVIGAEIVPEAITDAKQNATLNGIGNVAFEAGDLKDLLNHEFTARHGSPDVVVVDPPRAGMHPAVVERLIAMAPSRIVYVSCNPATQARDLALMKEHYRVSKVQPVDMFPQTAHVENVVRLDRR